MIRAWEKENTLYYMRFIDLTGLSCWDKVNNYSPFGRIANRKRAMVVHHDSFKLCSDGDLPIWLLRKRYELTRTLGEYVGDRVLEQATDALRDPNEYGEMNMGKVTIYA